jgi:hypothetical protein
MYQRAKLQISDKKQKQALKGAKIRLNKDDIGQGMLVMLHPVNYKKIMSAKGGSNLELSPGEMMATAAHHGVMPTPTDVSGSGIFDSIFKGLQSAGRFIKESGIGTILADAGQELAVPFLGQTGAKVARDIVRSTTGVGLAPMRRRGRPSKAKGAGLYL